MYRWYEVVNVYGTTIKELIHEEFGDGIMSAIDFSMDIQREPDPGRPRKCGVIREVLPYKTFSAFALNLSSNRSGDDPQSHSS